MGFTFHNYCSNGIFLIEPYRCSFSNEWTVSSAPKSVEMCVSRTDNSSLLRRFTFPLKKQVGENVELWNLGDAGIDGRFGMYSELTVNGETTADVVRVMGKCLFYIMHL